MLEHTAEIGVAMPVDVLNRDRRLTRKRGSNGFPVKAAYPCDRRIRAREIRRHQDPAVVGEGPGTGVEELVKGGLDGQSVVHRVRTVVRVPLHMGGIASEVVATQSW